MDIRTFVTSRTVKHIGIGLGIFVAVLIVFKAGMVVGYHQARFGGKLGDNYYRAFGEERMLVRGIPGDLPNAHGVIGRVVSVSLPTFVVADRDGVEKTVIVTDGTVMRRGRDEITGAEIKADEMVVVFGAPNDAAEIEARLIRIAPPRPENLQDMPEGGPARMLFIR